jgi:cell division transport system permease protein
MLVSEALQSIRTNLSTTVAATMTVLIGMFLLGLLIALGTWVLAWSDQAKERLLVKVYFCTPITCAQGKEATAPQIEAVRSRLLAMPEVKSVEFVSKAQALEIMKKETPELVEGLSTNPLPASLEVTPRRGEDVSTIARRLERASFTGVEKVNYGKKVAERILDVATVISSIFLVAVIVLVAASTLLIANTIRLSIFARRREIEVMKLVGASNWFVRGPFMIEGLLCGLAGSTAAVLLLFLAKEVASGRIDLDEDGVGAIAFGWNAVILLTVGLLLGALGSGLTLRRFLRV